MTTADSCPGYAERFRSCMTSVLNNGRSCAPDRCTNAFFGIGDGKSNYKYCAIFL